MNLNLYGKDSKCQYGYGTRYFEIDSNNNIHIDYLRTFCYKRDEHWNNCHYIQWKSNVRLEDSSHIFNVIMLETKLERAHS